jgi:hypothetical protein
MPGLVPAIHVLLAVYPRKDVDARHKAGHDEIERRKNTALAALPIASNSNAKFQTREVRLIG